MKKSQILLAVVATIGAFLVGQGVLTGEELTSVQNILGIAMTGGGVTAFGVIGILGAIPKQVVKSAYDKAIENYGSDKVGSFLDNIDTLIETVQTLTNKVDTLETKIDAQDEARNQLLS